MSHKISIIILDYLKSKRVAENVALLQKQHVKGGMEIIIVDNSCHAGNRKKLEELSVFKNVTLLFNEKNLGYTRAHNKAAKLVNGEYLFIVNPDILIREEGTLQRMVDYLDAHKDTAILGPKQINDNGETALTMRAFPKFHIQVARRTFMRNWPYFKKRVEYDEMRHLDKDAENEVDWLQSSFVAVRRDFWEQVGGLNEKYFLFMSDPDICHKAWRAGKKVIYFPQAVVYADGVRLSAGGFLEFFKKWTMRQHVIDSIKYRLRHLFKKNPRLKKL